VLALFDLDGTLVDRAAGLRTVWLSHGRRWPDVPKPDHIVATAAATVDLILA
jgi:FMN phosphatase YigB (HAD superfamily)